MKKYLIQSISEIYVPVHIVAFFRIGQDKVSQYFVNF